MSSLRVVIPVFLCLALLSGCAPEAQPVPEPAPSEVSPSPTASPEPSATPSPTKPALADLVISPEGLGPLTIGGDAASSGIVVFIPDYCRRYDPSFASDRDAGRWIADYPGDDQIPPYRVAVDGDGTVTNIDIVNPDLATAEGIHIGSTLNELRATYPDLVDDAADAASSTHLLQTPNSILLFEAVTAESSAPELAGQIALIRIVEPGSPWLGEAFATDSLIGGCL